jgi:hypothetical protein
LAIFEPFKLFFLFFFSLFLTSVQHSHQNETFSNSRPQINASDQTIKMVQRLQESYLKTLCGRGGLANTVVAQGSCGEYFLESHDGGGMGFGD